MSPPPLAGGLAAGRGMDGIADPILWTTRVPLAVIFLLLALIVAVPVVIQHRIVGHQREVLGRIAPAQRQAELLTTSLGGELLATRAYLISGDEAFVSRRQAYVSASDSALGALAEMVDGFGPELTERYAAMEAAMRRWREHLGEMTTLEPVPDLEAYRERIREDQTLFEQALVTSLQFLETARHAGNERLERIAELQRYNLWGTLGLALLALVAATLLALAGRKARMLAIGMRRRAQIEHEFRALAREMTEPDEPERVLEVAASGARRLSGSAGGYVERWLRDGERVAVVTATTGKGVPSRGTRIPLPGSLAKDTLDQNRRNGSSRSAAGQNGTSGVAGGPASPSDGAPVIHIDAMRPSNPPAERLRHHTSRRAALAVPLRVGDETLGALVLLRPMAPDPFPAADVERIQILADFASLSYRRALLVQESEDRKQEVERLMESRARLIRGFGHDLKNPLGAISGHADLLDAEIKGTLSSDQKDSITRIRRATRSMLDLIDDLVDLSRAQTGELSVSLQEVDVAGLVTGCAEEHGGEIESADLTFNVRIDEDIPPLETDLRRLQQVLSNLLSNAVKYTPSGGHIEFRAETREDARGRWVAISVRDDGPGIPSDQQERIFDEFFRLDSSAERGTGLGLTISRRIARVLGGDVTVESEVGVGSTFTLWIPVGATQSGADTKD